jgi:DNA polymerase-3 subunit delta
MGEEPYFIDLIADYIAENVLPESERSFNQTILYGKDTSIDTLLTVAKRFPMMSASQVVILKEAQNLKELSSGGSDNDDDGDTQAKSNGAAQLLQYIQNPLQSTILVICYKYKSIDKRKKFLKAATEKGIVFESPKIYENQLITWINKYVADNSYKITAQATALLAEYLGTEISKVANELDKLMILLPAGSTITPNDIEKNIGISKDYNVYELQNALGDRDILKANRIINYFGANLKQNPIPKTISSLVFFFSRILKFHFLPDKSKPNVAKVLGMNPYFVDAFVKAAKNYPPKKVVEIISLLRETDMKSKGIGNVSASEIDLQRELIYKILH